MLTLGLDYLTSRDSMDRYNIAKLEDHIEEYRLATLDHFISHGTGLSGTAVYLDYKEKRTQALIDSSGASRVMR